MKLGVFDSGLGGLLIAKAIREAMPDIDMLYYGDTLHLPYGSRSQDAIYNYTLQAVEQMFAADCGLIIIACNTASAAALRRLQQEYLPKAYPQRRILGVVVPTLEVAVERHHKKFGLLTTRYIADSGIYANELQKINPEIELYASAAPLLVPMIEQGGMKWIRPVLEDYMRPLLAKDIDCLLPLLAKDIDCPLLEVLLNLEEAQLKKSFQSMIESEGQGAGVSEQSKKTLRLKRICSS